MKQKKNLMMRLVVALVLLVGVCMNANADGQTLRLGGSIVGKIEKNGDIRKSGSIIGKVEKMTDIRQVAVMYFFDFFSL